MITLADTKMIFGNFTYTEIAGGGISIDKGWIASNIVEVIIPANKFGNIGIECHIKMRSIYEKILNEVLLQEEALNKVLIVSEVKGLSNCR